uniref:Caprin-1-like n=1 Tax=Sinocyclocheilus grahami TaxID=75366 RepID=A0A672QQK9_SINGR
MPCPGLSHETKTIKPIINEAFVASSGDIITDYNDIYCLFTRCVASRRVNIKLCICDRASSTTNANRISFIVLAHASRSTLDVIPFLLTNYQETSQHLWELLEGKDKPVAGTTYKALNEMLERVLQSGYFDRVQSHQNGVCTEEEEQTAAVEVSEAEEHPPDTGKTLSFHIFLNRQFVLESIYSTGDKEQSEEWSVETEVVNSMQPVQTAPTPVIPEPHPLTTTPTPPSEPVVRQQVVQDLMAQMKGPYNFMQDSMLDFDGQSLDPAIVLAQPMKPVPIMVMPPMVCQPVHSESRLAQPSAVGVQPEPTQIPLVSPSPETFSTPPPIYQSPHAADPRPQTDSIDPIQASMPLTEQPPPSTVLPPASQTQVIQPGSKPLHSSGINVNAAPFQSMQTVFHLNAPVPPANDTDSMKQASQYQNSYSLGFNNQTQHPVEHTDMPPEQLQSVVGAFHSLDQSLPNSTGGYDGYRPAFSNSANSGYGQTQFSMPRDYSNSSYQRDGYQPNYKRGAGQGARGVSRGNAPAMRS